jgi:hypothetical protein
MHKFANSPPVLSTDIRTASIGKHFYLGKDKGKVHPITGHEGPDGE